MFEGFGVGDPFVFWALRFLLVGVLFLAGWGISYDNPSKFKGYAWLAGVTYSLVEGLRWLRGADYPHYYNDLVTLFGTRQGAISDVVTPDPEPLYNGWVFLFHHSGLPFWVAFVFYSAILIWGVLRVLKHMPHAAFWALPLFFILTMSSSENLIRQYIAEAFLLHAYADYLGGNRKRMWTMLVCIPFIHFSGIIFAALFALVLYWPRRGRRRLTDVAMLTLLCGLFLYCYFFSNTAMLQSFADFLNEHIELVEETKGASYLEQADRWFTDEGSINYVLTGNVRVSTESLPHRTSRFLMYLSVVVLGFFVQKKNPQLTVAYVFAYLSIIVKLIGGDIEMFSRFYNWLVVLMPMVLGWIVWDCRKYKYLYMGLIGVFLVYFVFYSLIRGIASPSIAMFGFGFIWDADVNIWFR